MSELMMKEIVTELKKVRNDQKLTKDSISNLSETMATKEDVNMMKANISNLSASMATKEDVDMMKDEISNLKATMATKEDVADIPFMKEAIIEILDVAKRLESTQERHELTLDLLSRRSIDQEAEIKRIK